MKKIFLIFVSFIVLMTKDLYALSDNFLFVINKVGIPRFNAYKEEINESIYNLYNVFVYGAPERIVTYEQRWKNLSNGLWKYNGVGQRGEYSILGTDYKGNYVYNYYFPLDRVPTKPPDRWIYIDTPGALESWNDETKYKYIEQVLYMKETNFLFSDLSKPYHDSYNQIQYNVNALKVGLNKARLETCATWKSRGIIYTCIIGESGYAGYATFAVPPMAENAYILNSIDVGNDYTLEEDEDELIIPINYKAGIKNTSKYVTDEQVEEFNLDLYINGKKCSNKSGSKIMSVGSNYMLVISRNEFPPNSTPYKIKIVLKSYVETAFSVDGLLQSETEKEINVLIRDKYVEPVLEASLKVLLKKDNDWVVSPLAQIYKNSLGVTEAGKTLIAKLNLNVDEKLISSITTKLNNKEIEHTLIKSKNNTSIGVCIKLPIDLDTSLYGWKSLREMNQNYFLIDTNMVAKQMIFPHIIEIEVLCKDKKQLLEFSFNTIDDFLSNINFDISDMIMSDTKSVVALEEWLDE